MILEAKIEAERGEYWAHLNLHSKTDLDIEILHRYGEPKIEIPGGSQSKILEFHRDINIAVVLHKTREEAEKCIQEVKASLERAMKELRKRYDDDSDKGDHFSFEI